jgi:hypothetical protein
MLEIRTTESRAISHRLFVLWLYAICSFLRTRDERCFTNDAFDAPFREALERKALPPRFRFSV